MGGSASDLNAFVNQYQANQKKPKLNVYGSSDGGNNWADSRGNLPPILNASPDLTDQLIRNVERAERMRLKTGTTRASLFAAPKDPFLASAAPQKIPAPPPPTKKR